MVNFQGMIANAIVEQMDWKMKAEKNLWIQEPWKKKYGLLII